jgi:hypothetical protein
MEELKSALLADHMRSIALVLNQSPFIDIDCTLWEWTRLGYVKCTRVGSGKRKTVLYARADLQAVLTRHEAGSAS